METYKRNFRKVTYGYAEVEAKNEEEANDKFDSEDFTDEFDNKTNYEWND